MQSLDDIAPGRSGAEREFAAAFERLREDRPLRLPKGTPVSQNNVAKEAGCTASALRKDRFPELVEQIQDLVRPSTNRSNGVSQRLANAEQRNKCLLEEQAAQRGRYALETSRVLSLLAEVAELRRQVKALESELRGNIKSLK